MAEKTEKIEKHSGFSAEERAAMKEYAGEVKRARTRKADVDVEPEVLEKIAGMRPDDRALAERVHAIVRATAPELKPKLWYGMPAYANAAGKVVVFFQDAAKFKYRYATLGFQEAALLDEGTDGKLWPTSYALTEIDDVVAAQIAQLVRQAIGEA